MEVRPYSSFEGGNAQICVALTGEEDSAAALQFVMPPLGKLVCLVLRQWTALVATHAGPPSLSPELHTPYRLLLYLVAHAVHHPEPPMCHRMRHSQPLWSGVNEAQFQSCVCRIPLDGILSSALQLRLRMALLNCAA